MKKFSIRATAVVASIVVLGLGLSACGKKEGGATQVIASVDGEEITIHQMNGLLTQLGGVTPENLTKVKADILAGLVDQQIAVNYAVAQKLDRSPQVVAAIEQAKREILSRAAYEQLSAVKDQPTDDDAKKYYASNPALFSERRIYNLQELALAKSDKLDVAGLKSQLANFKSIEDAQAWAKQHEVKTALNSGVRAAEQLPLKILPQISQLKDGQMTLVEEAERFLVMRVVQSKTEPVAEAQALNAIKAFLINQKRKELLDNFKADARAKAKIQYFGDFVGGEAALKEKAAAELKAAQEAQVKAAQKAQEDEAALAAQKAQDRAAAQAAEEERSKARAEARAKSSSQSGSTAAPTAADLEKGLKGLK